VFEENPEGESGGIPGALGLFNLKGAAVQVLYIIATIISTITMVTSIIRSVATASIRAIIPAILKTLRHPITALKGLLGTARGFAGEVVEGLAGTAKWLYRWGRSAVRRRSLRGFFSSRGNLRGPGQGLKEFFWDKRGWDSIRDFRNKSFWLKQRLFGTSSAYNVEHIITQHFGNTRTFWQPLVNSGINTWLRIPGSLNSSLGNRIGSKLYFYSGALTAWYRSFEGGWSIGKSLTTEPAPDALP
jgi:hypothetical protein